MSTTNHRQKLLPFEGTKETKRLERVARLLGQDKRITTADKLPYFDYAEATRIATTNRNGNQG